MSRARRLLVLGANGQVGHELRRHLLPVGQVLPATRSGRLPEGGDCLVADLAEPGAVADLIAQQRPDAVINAAAYTAVDKAEDEPALAHRVNAEALAEIGAAAAALSIPVIHYSTDYVFPGDATQPYREDDATGPRSVYGASKLAGDQALAASGADQVVFRTAWVYAARGHNFLRTMLRVGAERDELRVVADQVGAPTPAWLIAAVTAQALVRWWATPAPQRAVLAGIRHLSCAGQVSWHGFAEAIFDRAVALGVIERRPRVLAIDSSQYPAKAARPAYSVLDHARLERDLGLQLPDWRQGLEQVLLELAPC